MSRSRILAIAAVLILFGELIWIFWPRGDEHGTLSTPVAEIIRSTEGQPSRDAASAAKKTLPIIGLVDIKRAVQGYVSAKEAAKELNENKSKPKQVLDARTAEMTGLVNRWEDAQRIMQDKLVNPELKQQKLAEAHMLAGNIKALEREIDGFRRRREQSATNR